jgi:catechol 2,3-dioxygenase-like lactoylglutathione lyase family enzyme
MDDGRPLAGNLVRVQTMLVVADLGRSVGFYADALGFGVSWRQDHIALLEREPMLLYLAAQGPPTPDKPGVSLGPPADPARTPALIILEVRDCAAAYAELARRGVEFLTPPHEPPWGGSRCFARDPDGYLVEVEQPPEERLRPSPPS